MKQKLYPGITIGAILLVAVSCQKRTSTPDCGGGESTVTTVTVISTGLNDPRGLHFGPDNYLYVAEAGVGGTDSVTSCAQVIPPVGPYHGSDTGARISRIDWQGNRSTFLDHLPSSITAPGGGNGIQGVADLAFAGKQMYAIFAGAGCSHAVPDIPNGVIRIDPDKSWKMLADLSQFIMENPVKNPNPGDFEPDGTWWNMINFGGNFYAIEPNHGELDKITPNGAVSRVADISAIEGHIVPTALAAHNGLFYVGNLNTFPVVPGSSTVFTITPGGKIQPFATGFTNILGLTFDDLGRLYVLETSTTAGNLTPGTGDIIRLDTKGKREVIASGLDFPTAMTFGPDGRLYVSAWGIGPPGAGQILQVAFKCEEVRGEGMK
ncbi:MAG TPA: ScyD/ScyE family protein [Puia sp.]|nr:ScyD/ScyE family protein [Puia sp.]